MSAGGARLRVVLAALGLAVVVTAGAVVQHSQVQQTERVASSGRPASPPARQPQAPQVGLARPGVSPSGLQRVSERLGSIANDIEAIFASFANGIDSPHSPVNDPAALRDAQARLDSATRMANNLAAELDDMGIHVGGADDAR